MACTCCILRALAVFVAACSFCVFPSILAPKVRGADTNNIASIKFCCLWTSRYEYDDRHGTKHSHRHSQIL